MMIKKIEAVSKYFLSIFCSRWSFFFISALPLNTPSLSLLLINSPLCFVPNASPFLLHLSCLSFFFIFTLPLNTLSLSLLLNNYPLLFCSLCLVSSSSFFYLYLSLSALSLSSCHLFSLSHVYLLSLLFPSLHLSSLSFLNFFSLSILSLFIFFHSLFLILSPLSFSSLLFLL